MSTIAQLLVKVTSEGLTDTTKGLHQLGVEAQFAQKAVKGNTDASVSSAKETRAEALAKKAVTDAATAEVRQRKELANALAAESRERQTAIREQRLEQSSHSRSSGLVSALTTQVMRLAAAYVSVQGAVRLFNETISTAAGYQTLERQLEFLTGGGVADATKELGYLTDVSNRYGTVLLQSTESYAALASAMKLSGISMQGVHQTYEALSAVAATYALSQDKVNAIMLAFTQIAGKGRVQSEELVRQLGQYIPALQLGAQAMGMSIRDFNAALKEGSVASADFLPKFSALIQEMYGSDLERKTDTITAAQNRFKTALQLSLNELGNNSGAMTVYKAVIQALTNQLNAFSGASLTDAIRNVTALGERLTAIKSGNTSWFQSNFGTKDQWRIVQEESEKFYLAQEQLKSRLAGASSSELRTSIDALDKSLAPLYDKYSKQKRIYGIKSTDTVDSDFLSTRGGSQYYTAIERGIAIRKQLETEFYKSVKTESDSENREEASARIKYTEDTLSSMDSSYKKWFDKQDKKYGDQRENIKKFYDDELTKLTDYLASSDEKIRLKAEAQTIAIKALGQSELSEYDAKENLKTARMEQSFLKFRASTLEELEVEKNAKQLELDSDKNIDDERRSNLQSILDRQYGIWNNYWSEVRSLHSQAYLDLSKQLGISTPKTTKDVSAEAGVKKNIIAGTNGLSDEERSALSVRLEMDTNKKLAAVESEREAIARDGYSIRQDNLVEALELQRVTEDEFNAQSLENYRTYVEEMNKTAAGKRAVQEAEMSINAEYLSQASSLVSGLAGLAKSGTATQKALFLTSKAIAVASILVSTEVAAMKAQAEGGLIFGMAAQSVIRTMGYASAAVVAAQTIAGLKTGGTLGDARDTQPGLIRGPGTGTSDSIYFRGSAWESILTADATKGIGVAAVDYINRNNRLPPGHNEGATLRRNGYGYANGGTLGYSAPIPTVNASSNVSVPIQINNTSDSTVTAKTQTINGQTIVQIAVAQAKAELYNDIASWNGPMANALSAQGVRRG